jgi:hypothetical protein
MAFLCHTITKAIIERARIGQTGAVISDVEFLGKMTRGIFLVTGGHLAPEGTGVAEKGDGT